jgi:hypothetical protein
MKTALGLFCFLLSAFGMAQEKDQLDKIESAKIALITERLELTPAQAEKFWPLYREYAERRQTLRKEFLSARAEVRKENMTEEESKKLLEKGLELKEKQVALDRDYEGKFNTIITTRQIVQLRRAEDDFRQMLLQRIEKRREVRDRIDRRDDRKNNE